MTPHAWRLAFASPGTETFHGKAAVTRLICDRCGLRRPPERPVGLLSGRALRALADLERDCDLALAAAVMTT